MRTGTKARRILNSAYDKHIYNIVELAERMGWAVSTCSKKLNNPKCMTIEEAVKLCKLTGYSITELINL